MFIYTHQTYKPYLISLFLRIFIDNFVKPLSHGIFLDESYFKLCKFIHILCEVIGKFLVSKLIHIEKLLLKNLHEHFLCLRYMLIHNKCSKNTKNCLLLEKSLQRQILLYSLVSYSFFAVKCLNTAKKEANIWLRVGSKYLSRDVEDKKDHVN